MRLTPLVFLLLPAVSDARTVVRELPPAPTLQITAEARASSLVLVFTNPTSQPIKIPARMNAHVVNYD